MPEAPEVACVLRALQDDLQDARIESVTITHPKLAASAPVEQFEKELAGETFRRFLRKGKYLVFELDHHFLVAHLRMEGKFLVLDNEAALSALDWSRDGKHIHAVFRLADGRILAYRDTRKFGRMYLYEKEGDRCDWRDLPCFEKVGKDALDPTLSTEELYEKASRRKIPLKSLLLDQSVIAGIGNIYADEILFESGLSPLCVASHLDLQDWQRVLETTRTILQEAIRHGGTTIRSFSYGNHQQGSYQDRLKMHGKEGACARCGGEIVHQRVGQRSTWYCPQCQKEK